MNSTKPYVDLLVSEFWKRGFTIQSRKYGKYLPEPPVIGDYKIDVLAKRERDFAIGIAISELEVNDSAILNKISYLASRVTHSTKRNVQLLIGAPPSCYRRIKELLDSVSLLSKEHVSLHLLADADADLFSVTYNRNAERAKALPFN
ncbi:MAG: hypothetical protein AB9882_06645 [Ignavibacteriaceae bacterium]